MKEQTVILLPADLHLIRKKVGSLDPGSVGGWVYFGKDACFSYALDRTLSHIPRISVGHRLQELAKEHRQNYIDFIGELSARFYGIPWWLTSVSEKNPFSSDLFLRFCWISLCREIAGKGAAPILTICETRGLMEGIRLNLAGTPGIRIGIEDRTLSRVRQNARAHATAVLQLGWFLGRYMPRILLARLFVHVRGRRNQGIPEEKRVMIHSWADQRAFTMPRAYTDIFTGILGSELMRRSVQTVYLVSILPTLFFPRGLLALRHVNEEVHLTEEFITLRDVVRAPLAVRKGLPSISDGTVMGGIDLAPVIREELAGDGQNSRRELSFLMYCAARRIGQRVPLRAFIYTFENHMWEKMVCMGLEETSSSTRRIGYAHSIVNSMYLSYSLSNRERGIAPLPHLIAVNGPRARDVLVGSGFNSGSIFLSGSLRYQNFPGKQERQRGSGSNTVLVALPIGFDESLELVLKSLQALGGSAAVQVILKCHPSLPPDRLVGYLPNLPENASFSIEPIDTLLKRVDLVMYTSSTVAVEAIARGIPVIHVKSDLTIDRNIFDGESRIPSCATPGEISSAVHGLLGGQVSESEVLPSLAAGIFAPVREENLEKFAGKN